MHQRSVHVIRDESDVSGDNTHTHTRTYPELATLFSDHFPVLHHVDRTLVDGVVCFVSQPVLVTLTERDRGGVTSQFTSVPVKNKAE